MSTEYYDILGVSKDATKDEIKKAYRKKAKENHPDKGGDEKKFKEINEAYQTLSDDQKRSQYDQFGSSGGPFGGAGGGAGGFDFSSFSSQFGGASGGMGGFEDIFSSFFGGGTGGQSRSSRRTKGSDMEVEVELTFDEALEGVVKTFNATLNVVCNRCEGKGGKGKKTCTTCKGSGHVAQRFQTPFGVVSQNTTCPDCQGSGETFEDVCSFCHGDGRREERTKIEVEIPAGVRSGEAIKVAGKGEAGIRGGQAGDLYVHIRVKDSSRFERQGMDILSDVDIPIFDALLGGEFKVKTFWDTVTIKVPENTKEGTKLKIRGQGVKKGAYTGDHIVQIRYTMPKKISKKLRAALEEAKRVS